MCVGGGGVRGIYHLDVRKINKSMKTRQIVYMHQEISRHNRLSFVPGSEVGQAFSISGSLHDHLNRVS